MTRSESAPDAGRARGSRKSLLRVGAAAFVVALFGGYLFASSGIAQSGDAETTRPTDAERAARGERNAPPWTEAEGMKQCESDNPGAYWSLPSTGELKVLDRATGLEVTIDAREFCRQAVPLVPDPLGDMAGEFYVANGRVAVTYREIAITIEETAEGAVSVGAIGEVIPVDEAQQRLAAQKAARPS